MITNARDLALLMHAGQFYPPDGSDKLPFEVHLGHVIGVLLRFDFDQPEMHAAAWLHDVLEDTTVTEDAVLKAAGAAVLRLVRAVTDASGATREERKAKTYPQIVEAGPAAVALKLADRIANVESSIAGYHRYLVVYAREHESFAAALRDVGRGEPCYAKLKPMWAYLDHLLSVQHLTKVVGHERA